MTPSTSTANQIAALNDEFRRMGPLFGWSKFEGLWLVTAGVQAKGPIFTQEALNAVLTFDGFTRDNDPYGEHDFGCFEVEGQKLFWKIDYLERGTEFGAEDPANNVTTCRMITIMLASEY